ncbi:MAG: hypothetical protein JSS81_21665 [Acidobacteria bacterium]|nr:hypothetical protein [Acidobacteriota bacterium]
MRVTKRGAGLFRPNGAGRLLLLFILTAAFGSFAAAQSVAETPVRTTVCAIMRDPGAFDKKLVEVTGLVSHGFEDFSLIDPDCEAISKKQSLADIWVEYAKWQMPGKDDYSVENIPIHHIIDQNLQVFDGLVEEKGYRIIHATLVGRFFAGQKVSAPEATFWWGYGHGNCCSLLSVEQVVAVDPHDRADIDYNAYPGEVGYANDDRYGFFDPPVAPIDAQRAADAGKDAWRFDDPRRAAVQGLARTLKLPPSKIARLEQIDAAPGRFFYEWKRTAKISYVIVVSRPYLMTFYARDPRKIAWVAIAVYGRGDRPKEESSRKNDGAALRAKPLRKVLN